MEVSQTTKLTQPATPKPLYGSASKIDPFADLFTVNEISVVPGVPKQATKDLVTKIMGEHIYPLTDENQKVFGEKHSQALKRHDARITIKQLVDDWEQSSEIDFREIYIKIEAILRTKIQPEDALFMLKSFVVQT